MALGLVDEHLKTCVAAAEHATDDSHRERKIAEAVGAIERLLRT